MALEIELSFLLYGAFVGLVYAGLGYLKNRGREEFAALKFGRTVALGAVVGAAATALGVDVSILDFESLTTVAGFIYILQTLLQAFLARKEGGK
ncbi:MAG: hypothetical protein QXD61_11810 [Candidatus Caldarchaeum sp.]